MALFETNPLALAVANSTPIKSIAISSNLDWFSVPADPLTGESAILNVNAKTNIASNLVFATGSLIGTPSMRSLTAAHIPNISMAQVTGLQSAINSIVKTLSGGGTFLTVAPNGSGDYQLTVNTGATPGTLAVGNDPRFPSSITGIRKGAGVGSADTAAVVTTDYWDNRIFVASGGSHARGLVPDPGAVGGNTKFLCEDATFKVPTGSGTITSVTWTSPLAATQNPTTTVATASLLVNTDFLFTAAQSVTVNDAGTNNAPLNLTLNHNSSLTPAADFGVAIAFALKSSTTNNRPSGNIISAWSVATDASRVSYLDLQAYSVSVAKGIRIWGSGGLSVNNTTDPGAGIVSANSGFKIGAVAAASGHYLRGNSTNFVDGTIQASDLPVFVGIGPSNAQGAVPAPGNPGGAPVRYLREDSSWQLFTPAAASITSAMLSTMTARTLLANATAGSASPTAVSALAARSSLLLNLESITTFGNTNYTALATDRYVATSAAFTATRTVTLPLANTFNPSQQITISDDFGAINGAFVLNIARQGSDTIQGSSSALVMDVQFGSYHLTSDGVSKWFVTRRTPSIIRKFITSNSTYTTPTGVKAIFIEGIAGGGGGGGAIAIASNCSLGGGGGAGGYANKFISTPASSYAITVGGGGLGGVGASNGANGTDTVVGAVLSAQGGGGGSSLAFGTTAAVIASGAGGGATTGDIQTQGSYGQPGLRISGTVGLSGGSGGTIYGPAVAGLGVAESNGNTGVGYGAGGGGAISYSTNSKTGGSGLPGLVIMTEYY